MSNKLEDAIKALYCKYHVYDFEILDAVNEKVSSIIADYNSKLLYDHRNFFNPTIVDTEEKLLEIIETVVSVESSRFFFENISKESCLSIVNGFLKLNRCRGMEGNAVNIPIFDGSTVSVFSFVEQWNRLHQDNQIRYTDRLSIWW